MGGFRILNGSSSFVPASALSARNEIFSAAAFAAVLNKLLSSSLKARGVPLLSMLLTFFSFDQGGDSRSNHFEESGNDGHQHGPSLKYHLQVPDESIIRLIAKKIKEAMQELVQST